MKLKPAASAKSDSPPRRDRGERATDSAILAAVTIQGYVSPKRGDIDVIRQLTDALRRQAQAVRADDLSRAEEMLSAQAHTLDALFNTLALRAAEARVVNQFEIYLRLALRAQAQCRATWESLATIKHPPIAGYVGQANIAHGPQQVNNTAPGETQSSRARENENRQSKLLEQSDGNRLDFGATGTSGSTDPALETVGAVDSTQKRGG